MAAPARTRTAFEIEAARAARAEKVEALNEQLAEAVERLATSEGWVAMLAVAARFRRYSVNNQILLWAQAEERGVTLTRVASFGTWKSLGYMIKKGSKGFGVFAPVRSRLRAEEIAEWQSTGRDPFDGEGRPKMVVRGFTGRVRLRPGAGRARAGTRGAGRGARVDQPGGQRARRFVVGAGDHDRGLRLHARAAAGAARGRRRARLDELRDAGRVGEQRVRRGRADPHPRPRDRRSHPVRSRAPQGQPQPGRDRGRLGGLHRARIAGARHQLLDRRLRRRLGAEGPRGASRGDQGGRCDDPRDGAGSAPRDRRKPRSKERVDGTGG